MTEYKIKAFSDNTIYWKKTTKGQLIDQSEGNNSEGRSNTQEAMITDKKQCK